MWWKMIQTLVKVSDLSKLGITKNLKIELEKILNCQEYIEIGFDQKLYLSVKPQENTEIVFLQDDNDAIFLKNIRDNYDQIKNFARHKNLLQKINKNKIDLTNFFISQLLRLKLKKETQVKSLYNKISKLQSRLQNVFIVSGDFNNFIRNFDHSTALFVFSNLNEFTYNAIKKIRYANILVFISQSSVPYKKLKELQLRNLSSNKESTKYIWHRASK